MSEAVKARAFLCRKERPMPEMSDVRCYRGGPLILAEYDGGTDERSVEERIERVIGDLSQGRVVPGQVDRLDEAVKRQKINQHLFRAIR